MRIGIYCRLSQDDGFSTSIERQEAVCREEAQRRGWEVAASYSDTIGAFARGKTRPEFERILRDLTEGSIEGAIFYHVDRVTRQPREMERLIDIQEDSKRPVVIVSGDIDLSTPNGRFVARLLVSQANMESENTSRRIRLMNKERAEKGLPATGSRAFGFEKDGIAHNPEEAALIREAADRIIKGEAITAVANDFKRRGITGTRGTNSLSTTQLKRILLRVRNVGYREHEGKLYPAVWEPIFSEDTLDALRAILNGKQRSRVSRSYMLAGILFCGRCGFLMYGAVAKPPRQRNYRCISVAHSASCGRTTISADIIENVLWSALMKRIEGQDLSSFFDAKNEDSYRELAELEARQSGLLDFYVNGDIDQAAFRKANGELGEKIAELQAKISRGSLGFLAGIDAETAESLSIPSKNLLMRAALEKVTINPGKRASFDLSRIDPLWKL